MCHLTISENICWVQNHSQLSANVWSLKACHLNSHNRFTYFSKFFNYQNVTDNPGVCLLMSYKIIVYVSYIVNSQVIINYSSVRCKIFSYFFTSLLVWCWLFSASSHLFSISFHRHTETFSPIYRLLSLQLSYFFYLWPSTLVWTRFFRFIRSPDHPVIRHSITCSSTSRFLFYFITVQQSLVAKKCLKNRAARRLFPVKYIAPLKTTWFSDGCCSVGFRNYGNDRRHNI